MSFDRLTVKQEKFARIWFETGNKSEAYRQAYDCEGMSDKQINEEASKLSNNPKVTQRFEELQDRAAQASDITHDRITRELVRVAFFDPANLFNESGVLRSIHEIDRDARAAIASIEQTTVGAEKEVIKTTVKTHDKFKYLESLSRRVKYYDVLADDDFEGNEDFDFSQHTEEELDTIKQAKALLQRAKDLASARRSTQTTE